MRAAATHAFLALLFAPRRAGDAETIVVLELSPGH